MDQVIVACRLRNNKFCPMALVSQETSAVNNDSSEQPAIRNLQSAIVILTTTETPLQAEHLAQLLVEAELAACVQILPPMTSIYRWQGKVERATETLVLIKTLREKYAALEAALKTHHPYQTPELLALPIEAGSAAYLAWLADSVSGSGF
jgi:periplasmic divalent cation tolerance protein